MEIEAIAGMITGVVVTMLVAGTILLFPLVRRLGDLLEIRAAGRREAQTGEQLKQLGATVAALADRIDALESRQDFTDALARPGQPERQELAGGRAAESGFHGSLAP